MKNIYIKHILLLAGMGAGLLIFLSLALNIYTRHGQSSPVPDFSGMTVQEAESIVRSYHLRYKINDSVYQNDAAPGVILSQNPEPGTMVKHNRTLFFIVNASEPEKTEAPSVVGLSLRQARSILESKGLQVGKLMYIPDIARNNVLRQQVQGKTLDPGTEIIKGSTVDLVLGLGNSVSSTGVPNVIGLSLSSAQEKLNGNMLNIGNVFPDSSIQSESDSLRAVVWSQSPGPSGQSPAGSVVDIWITTDAGLLPEGIHVDSDMPENDLEDME